MNESDITTFDRDGVLVYLTYSDILDVEDVELVGGVKVDVSVLVSDEEMYPVVAEGFFDQSGVWRFFKTYSSSVEYDMNYTEFATALEQTE